MRTSDFVLQIAKKEQNYLLKTINEFTQLTIQERENLRQIFKLNKIRVNYYDF